MLTTPPPSALTAGKAAPVQGRRHAAANPLRAQRVARRAAAPASRTATVTKAVKVRTDQRSMQPAAAVQPLPPRAQVASAECAL